jgi:hypothetical protein
LASQLSFQWYRQDRNQPKYEADGGPLTDNQIDQIQEAAKKTIPGASRCWEVIRAQPSQPVCSAKHGSSQMIHILWWGN